MQNSAGFAESGSGIEDLVNDAGGPPPFNRLTDMPEFQLEQIGFAIGAGDGQEA